ncbi:tetratricopeptide repeat protein [Frigoriglobus tundricola]|uniref:tetratricopeptide repeat protein n=1 Tax=Frigoriglobus tundricola TaxID=2774151 RepID=UPI00148E98D4|nr:tetratricopeptide repeat protein [Frigoriglobus tundricola]
MADDILARPQPVGVFPLPAGYLLLPPAADPTAGAELRAGRTPTEWPSEWQFFASVLGGGTGAALDRLATGHGPLPAYNRFVLDPNPQRFAEARAHEPLRTLVDVVAYSVGLLDHPPDASDLDGELLAHALAAHAAHALGAGDPIAVAAHLGAAIAAARGPSPLFAAQLLGQLAAVLRDAPERGAEAIAHYQDAIRLAADTPLVRLRAELWFALGTTYLERADGRRGALLEAVKAYQQAIQCGLSVDAHPDLFAEAHNNLGLAYISIPAASASDQLRMAVAIQSFREALKVYTREAHPDRWASTTLNLANAIQYVPSGHPEQNLMRAVELYDEVLTVRTRPADPVGYARVLANQANALAHLGVFGPALEKLNEAHKLFHWYEEPAAAASVMELVDQITACRDRAAAEPVEG